MSLALSRSVGALEAVLVDFAGEVRARESHEYRFPDSDLVRKAGNTSLANVYKLVDGLDDASIVGLGIASPYFLGGWSEELGFPDDLGARWEAIDLMTFFAARPKTLVFVENDASAAALAELIQGAGARFRDFTHRRSNRLDKLTIRLRQQKDRRRAAIVDE